MLGGIGKALGGLVGTVGNVIGDPLGHGAIDRGMSAQANATGASNALLEKLYNEQKADIEPWRAAGLSALSEMGSDDFKRDFRLSDFEKDPGYEFRMAEGQKAIERSAAAKGGLQSGGFMKSLSRYGQDYASNEYGNAYNRFNSDRDRRFGRLSSIAGIGQNALGQRLNASSNYGSQVSANNMGYGNAVAAGNVAKANANQQLVGGLTSFAMGGGGKKGA